MILWELLFLYVGSSFKRNILNTGYRNLGMVIWGYSLLFSEIITGGFRTCWRLNMDWPPTRQPLGSEIYFLFVFDIPMVFSAYYCTQKSLLEVLRKPYGIPLIKPGLAEYKASNFTIVLTYPGSRNFNRMSFICIFYFIRKIYNPQMSGIIDLSIQRMFPRHSIN